MEELEQASNLVALGDEAEEVLRKVCKEQSTNQEAVQAAFNNLVTICVYSAEQTANAFAALRDSFAEAVTPVITLAEQIASILPTEDAFFMVPPHIRHLAYNHPKARVRNKNYNRMCKIRERYMKWNKD